MSSNQEDPFSLPDLCQALMETMPVGVVYQSANGAIFAVNPAAEKILGLTLDQMQGRTSFDPGWHAIREDGSVFRGGDHPSMQALRTGQTIQNVVMGVYNPQTATDNWIKITAIPQFKNQFDKPYMVISTFEDITEQKLNEKVAHTTTVKLEAALGSMNDAVFISDTGGRFINFNEAFATFHKFKNKDECAKTLTEYPAFLDVYLQSGELAPLDQWAVPRALRGETGTNVEYGLRRKDTGETWIGSYSFAPVRDEDGVIIGSVVVGRDITAIKQDERKILQLKRLYATLSQVNQTIVQVKDPTDLYQSICDAAVKYGEFALAWVGLLDEATGEVKPVAANGLDLAHWPFRIVNIRKGASKDGLVATAIRNSKVVTSEDIGVDKRTLYQLQQLEGYNYHSSAAVPFQIKGITIGMLCLVSGEEGLFKVRDEIKLLEEMGLDISFALDTMENEIIMHQWVDAFENCAHGIVIGNPKTNQILTCNPAFARAQGSTIEELIFTPLVDMYKKQDQEQIKKFISQADSTGSVQFEAQKIRKDGSFYEVQMDLVSVRDKDGSILYRVASQQDITERKRIEEALERTRNMLVEAQKIAHMGSFEYIVATQTTNWSEEEYHIYGLDPTGPSPAFDLMLEKCIHPEDAALLNEKFTLALQNQSVYELEHRIVQPNGSVRWVYDTAHPYFNKQGNLIRYIGITLDITERKRAEEEILRLNAELEERVIRRTAQLETANKDLEAFSYSVSHDLRAPLRALSGFTNILIEDYADTLDAEGKRICSVIINESQRMGLLIDNLLDFSRIGRSELHKSLIDMQALVHSVFDELTPSGNRARIVFRMGKLQPVFGDPALIRQVWVNLLSNALKFTSGKDKAIIEVESVMNKNVITYSIRDNGAGFDMKYAGKLFGVFQRLHSESEFEGTGVGLAIVNRVVSRHGGRVWGEGEIDKGATFSFTLPKKEVLNG